MYIGQSLYFLNIFQDLQLCIGQVSTSNNIITQDIESGFRLIKNIPM